MSIIRLVTRVNAICKKYDKCNTDKRVNAICKKYDKCDTDKLKEANNNAFADGAFARLCSVLEAELEQALQNAEAVSHERNRARVVALNAEIRRSKDLC